MQNYIKDIQRFVDVADDGDRRDADDPIVLPENRKPILIKSLETIVPIADYNGSETFT